MQRCPACGRESAGEGKLCAECQAQGQPPSLSPRHEVTLLLVAINVLVFAIMAVKGVSISRPSFEDLIRFGANQGGYTLFNMQFWRLLTSNYVHIGVVHLLVNMYCLWGLGKLVELFYHRLDYVLLYTYTGIAGSILSVWSHPGVTSAGASGAVFGLAGVLLTTLKFGHLPLAEPVRAALFKNILQFAGINLVMGMFILRVDNAGHLGGLLSGLIVGGALGKHLDGSEASRDRRRWRWLVLWGCLLAAMWLARMFWIWVFTSGRG